MRRMRAASRTMPIIPQRESGSPFARRGRSLFHAWATLARSKAKTFVASPGCGLIEGERTPRFAGNAIFLRVGTAGYPGSCFMLGRLLFAVSGSVSSRRRCDKGTSAGHVLRAVFSGGAE
jgi:hypothetical protein